jgi:hypothetical protein
MSTKTTDNVISYLGILEGPTRGSHRTTTHDLRWCGHGLCRHIPHGQGSIMLRMGGGMVMRRGGRMMTAVTQKTPNQQPTRSQNETSRNQHNPPGYTRLLNAGFHG